MVRVVDSLDKKEQVRVIIDTAIQEIKMAVVIKLNVVFREIKKVLDDG